MTFSASDRRMIARLTYLDYRPLIEQSERTIARLEAEIDALTVAGICIDVVAAKHLSEALDAERARLLRYQCAESAADDDLDGTYDR